MLLGSLNWNVSDVRSAKLAKGSGRVKPKPIMAVRNPSGRIRKRQTQAVRRGNSKRIDLNDSNRQVRTRMPGGVGGGEAPYPDPDQIPRSFLRFFCFSRRDATDRGGFEGPGPFSAVAPVLWLPGLSLSESVPGAPGWRARYCSGWPGERLLTRTLPDR